MTPYTLLCDNLGDLWKLWPDGRCCPIDDEDDLRDARKIDALTPSPDSLKRLLKAKDGQVITWIPCSTCEGSGTYVGVIVHDKNGREVRPDFWPHETLPWGHYRDDGSMPCPDCNGSGREPFWTGERVLIEGLVNPERAA